MERLVTFQPTIVPVGESSQVFEARRAALSAAKTLQWGEESAGKVAIAVTEAATNLLKHAGGGALHIQPCQYNGAVCIEMISVDRGPGMANISASLADGVSTAGTSGTGLGAIRRLSSEFDIYSQPKKGTIVMARFYPNGISSRVNPPREAFTVGAIQVALRGESVCGDSWAIRLDSGRMTILVADGLGHGTGAAQASQEAVAVLAREKDLSPLSLLEAVHGALRSTRGAAVAISSVDAAAGRVTFAGVGNIRAVILEGGQTQNLVSHNGTAGVSVRKLQDFTYPWGPRRLLLMHSDGITTSWSLDGYPGLAQRHPSIIAAALHRDASRGRDDACIVVVRQNEAALKG